MTDLEQLILTARGTLDLLELKLAGGSVRRYHTEEGVHQQTVAEHSWRMAVILHHLYPGRQDLLVAALHHDLAEGLLGDIPAPVKRWPGLKAATADLETSYMNFIGVQFPLGDTDETRLKCVDYLELVATTARQPGKDAARIAATGAGYVTAAAHALPAAEAVVVLELLQRFYPVSAQSQVRKA